MKCLRLFSFGFVLMASTLAYAGKRHAGAHVHGAGELNLVLDKKVLSLELLVPSESIFGFEHEAKSDADQKKVADAMGMLQDPAALFVVEGAGLCQMAAVKVAVNQEALKPQSEKKSVKQHKKAAHDHQEAHSDVMASYTITCEKSEGFTSLQVKLFERFPNIQKLRLSFVGELGQRSGVLTKKSSNFSWKK